MKRFACKAELWLGQWQPTEREQSEQPSYGSSDDPLGGNKKYGETESVILIAVHPSEFARISSATAMAASAARHGDSALIRL